MAGDTYISTRTFINEVVVWSMGGVVKEGAEGDGFVRISISEKGHEYLGDGIVIFSSEEALHRIVEAFNKAYQEALAAIADYHLKMRLEETRQREEIEA